MHGQEMATPFVTTPFATLPTGATGSPQMPPTPSGNTIGGPSNAVGAPGDEGGGGAGPDAHAQALMQAHAHAHALDLAQTQGPRGSAAAHNFLVPSFSSNMGPLGSFSPSGSGFGVGSGVRSDSRLGSVTGFGGIAGLGSMAGRGSVNAGIGLGSGVGLGSGGEGGGGRRHSGQWNQAAPTEDGWAEDARALLRSRYRPSASDESDLGGPRGSGGFENSRSTDRGGVKALDLPAETGGSRRLPMTHAQRSLPLSSAYELEKGDFGARQKSLLSHVRGKGLERERSMHWADLWSRDTRVFLRALLEKVGVPLDAANHRLIPASRLASAVRDMGLSPRSQIVTFLAEHLTWAHDDQVSLARLVSQLGALPDPTLPPEEKEKLLRSCLGPEHVDTSWDFVSKIFDDVALEQDQIHCQPLGSSFQRPGDKPGVQPSSSQAGTFNFLTQRMLENATAAPQLTQASVAKIRDTYKTMRAGKVPVEDAVLGIQAITGASTSCQLREALRMERTGSRPLFSRIYAAALRDLQQSQQKELGVNDSGDIEAGHGCMSADQRRQQRIRRNGDQGRRKPKDNVASLLTPHDKYGSSNRGKDRGGDLGIDGGQADGSGRPSQYCLRRLREAIALVAEFPIIPLQSDLQFLHETAHAVASGNLSLAVFRQLLDAWNLPLNGKLIDSVQDLQARGRCSLPALLSGLQGALSAVGVHFTTAHGIFNF